MIRQPCHPLALLGLLSFEAVARDTRSPGEYILTYFPPMSSGILLFSVD